MAASRAERAATPARPATPWESLGRRQQVELAMPGVAIGLLSGVIAGGIVAAAGFTADVVVFAGVSFALLLAAAGAGYELLLARGRFPLGALAPVAIYFMVAFPLVRVLHAGLFELYAGPGTAVTHGWLDFVLIQLLLSVGFGIGYWWLHENFAPRWWFHVREHNPVADFFVRVQLQYAAGAEHEQQQRTERNAARRKRRR
jgi:hypothetical protein